MNKRRSIPTNPKLTNSAKKAKPAVSHGYTMLMLRVEEGNIEEIRSMFDRKSVLNVNTQSKTGQTALALAARNGNLTIAEYLVSQGADLNTQNKSGQTPLFIACWFGFYNIVELFLREDANVNIADYRGWTPLMIACYHGYTDIVQLLLQSNADILAIDCFGKKAIDRCKDPGIFEILQELEERLDPPVIEDTKADEKSLSPTPYIYSRNRGRRGINTESSSERSKEHTRSPEEKCDTHFGVPDNFTPKRSVNQFIHDPEIYRMHQRVGYYSSLDKRSHSRNSSGSRGRSRARSGDKLNIDYYDEIDETLNSKGRYDMKPLEAINFNNRDDVQRYSRIPTYHSEDLKSKRKSGASELNMSVRGNSKMLTGKTQSRGEKSATSQSESFKDFKVTREDVEFLLRRSNKKEPKSTRQANTKLSPMELKRQSMDLKRQSLSKSRETTKESAKENVRGKKTSTRKDIIEEEESRDFTDTRRGISSYVKDYSNRMEKVVNKKVSYALNFEWKRNAYKIRKVFFEFLVRRAKDTTENLLKKVESNYWNLLQKGGDDSEMAGLKEAMERLSRDLMGVWDMGNSEAVFEQEEKDLERILLGTEEIDRALLADLDDNCEKEILKSEGFGDLDTMRYLKDELQINVDNVFKSLNSTIARELVKTESLVSRLLRENIKETFGNVDRNLGKFSNDHMGQNVSDIYRKISKDAIEEGKEDLKSKQEFLVKRENAAKKKHEGLGSSALVNISNHSEVERDSGIYGAILDDSAFKENNIKAQKLRAQENKNQIESDKSDEENYNNEVLSSIQRMEGTEENLNVVDNGPEELEEKEVVRTGRASAKETAKKSQGGRRDMVKEYEDFEEADERPQQVIRREEKPSKEVYEELEEEVPRRVSINREEVDVIDEDKPYRNERERQSRSKISEVNVSRASKGSQKLESSNQSFGENEKEDKTNNLLEQAMQQREHVKQAAMKKPQHLLEGGSLNVKEERNLRQGPKELNISEQPESETQVRSPMQGVTGSKVMKESPRFETNNTLPEPGKRQETRDTEGDGEKIRGESRFNKIDSLWQKFSEIMAKPTEAYVKDTGSNQNSESFGMSNSEIRGILDSQLEVQDSRKIKSVVVDREEQKESGKNRERSREERLENKAFSWERRQGLEEKPRQVVDHPRKAEQQELNKYEFEEDEAEEEVEQVTRNVSARADGNKKSSYIKTEEYYLAPDEDGRRESKNRGNVQDAKQQASGKGTDDNYVEEHKKGEKPEDILDEQKPALERLGTSENARILIDNAERVTRPQEAARKKLAKSHSKDLSHPSLQDLGDQGESINKREGKSNRESVSPGHRTQKVDVSQELKNEKVKPIKGSKTADEESMKRSYLESDYGDTRNASEAIRDTTQDDFGTEDEGHYFADDKSREMRSASLRGSHMRNFSHDDTSAGLKRKNVGAENQDQEERKDDRSATDNVDVERVQKGVKTIPEHKGKRYSEEFNFSEQSEDIRDFKKGMENFGRDNQGGDTNRDSHAREISFQMSMFSEGLSTDRPNRKVKAEDDKRGVETINQQLSEDGQETQEANEVKNGKKQEIFERKGHQKGEEDDFLEGQTEIVQRDRESGNLAKKKKAVSRGHVGELIGDKERSGTRPETQESKIQEERRGQGELHEQQKAINQQKNIEGLGKMHDKDSSREVNNDEVTASDEFENEEIARGSVKAKKMPVNEKREEVDTQVGGATRTKEHIKKDDRVKIQGTAAHVKSQRVHNDKEILVDDEFETEEAVRDPIRAEIKDEEGDVGAQVVGETSTKKQAVKEEEAKTQEIGRQVKSPGEGDEVTQPAEGERILENKSTQMKKANNSQNLERDISKKKSEAETQLSPREQCLNEEQDIFSNKVANKEKQPTQVVEEESKKLEEGVQKLPQANQLTSAKESKKDETSRLQKDVMGREEQLLKKSNVQESILQADKTNVELQTSEKQKVELTNTDVDSAESEFRESLNIEDVKDHKLPKESKKTHHAQTVHRTEGVEGWQAAKGERSLVREAERKEKDNLDQQAHTDNQEGQKEEDVDQKEYDYGAANDQDVKIVIGGSEDRAQKKEQLKDAKQSSQEGTHSDEENERKSERNLKENQLKFTTDLQKEAFQTKEMPGSLNQEAEESRDSSHLPPRSTEQGLQSLEKYDNENLAKKRHVSPKTMDYSLTRGKREASVQPVTAQESSELDEENLLEKSERDISLQYEERSIYHEEQKIQSHDEILKRKDSAGMKKEGLDQILDIDECRDDPQDEEFYSCGNEEGLDDDDLRQSPQRRQPQGEEIEIEGEVVNQTTASPGRLEKRQERNIESERVEIKLQENEPKKSMITGNNQELSYQKDFKSPHDEEKSEELVSSKKDSDLDQAKLTKESKEGSKLITKNSPEGLKIHQVFYDFGKEEEEEYGYERKSPSKYKTQERTFQEKEEQHYKPAVTGKPSSEIREVQEILNQAQSMSEVDSKPQPNDILANQEIEQAKAALKIQGKQGEHKIPKEIAHYEKEKKIQNRIGEENPLRDQAQEEVKLEEVVKETQGWTRKPKEGRDVQEHVHGGEKKEIQEPQGEENTVDTQFKNIVDGQHIKVDNAHELVQSQGTEDRAHGSLRENVRLIDNNETEPKVSGQAETLRDEGMLANQREEYKQEALENLLKEIKHTAEKGPEVAGSKGKVINQEAYEHGYQGPQGDDVYEYQAITPKKEAQNQQAEVENDTAIIHKMREDQKADKKGGHQRQISKGSLESFIMTDKTGAKDRNQIESREEFSFRPPRGDERSSENEKPEITGINQLIDDLKTREVKKVEIPCLATPEEHKEAEDSYSYNYGMDEALIRTPGQEKMKKNDSLSKLIEIADTKTEALSKLVDGIDTIINQNSAKHSAVRILRSGSGNSFNLNVSSFIPSPMPSRYMKGIKERQIDQLTYSEGFDDPGQSNRSRSLSCSTGFPRNQFRLESPPPNTSLFPRHERNQTSTKFFPSTNEK